MADMDIEDVSQLERLDDDSIREALKTRYTKDKIYTNCGDMLIAVNPFKDLQIFTERQHEEYDWKALQRNPSPHVFYMASRAYRRMQETRTNQVILVGGESGTGKTENTKYIVKHLVKMCPTETSDLHQRIVKINPLLEAFGNAKTTLNENSSRFAKYLEMMFSADGQVQGAIVRDYLLEKSRVVDQLDKEGNFHIFYCMLAGAPAALLKTLRLQDASAYRILKRNRDLLGRKEFYRDMYLEQIEVLKSIDMEPQDIDIIHNVLAAILHITQVEFVEPDDPNELLQIRDCSSVEIVADLLTVPYEDLGHALIATKQTFVGETIVTRKSMSQAIDSRDAFAKALYERLFGWIVRQINMNLHPSKLKATGGWASIGLLDMAGFEKLESNSLEQMCINLINERLQNFTNKNVVDFEMSIYKEEGIHVSDINFKNNDAVLNMFMKKTFGILPLLDEESKFGHGTNERFIRKLKDNYDKHECFTASPHGRAEFCVKHFAAQVWYDGSMLIEKNRDLVSPDVITCMQESDNPFVSDLFTARKGPTGTISATVHNIRKSTKAVIGNSKKPSIRQGQPLLVDRGVSLKQRYKKVETGTSHVYSPKDQTTVMSYFQTSMNELLLKMRQAEPYYVRCIKPNMFLQPNNFDDEKVSEQILYNGISEVAKIRKLGLPVRKRYEEFTKRYRPLFLECRKSQSHRAGTDLLLHKILPVQMMPGIKFGNTRLFMKEDVNIWLEKCRGIRERTAADIIAKGWREYSHDRRRKQDEAKAHNMRELDTNHRAPHNIDNFSESSTDEDSDQSDTTHSSIDGNKNLANSFNPLKYRDENITKSRAPSPQAKAQLKRELDSILRATDNIDDFSESSTDEDRYPSNTTYSPFDANKLANSVIPQKYRDENRTKKKKIAPSPPDVASIPDRHTNTDADLEQDLKPTKKENKKFWDIFNIISRESNREDFHMGGRMKIVKIITYLVLGLLLLVCSVLQKISLATLVSNASGFHHTLLLFVMCIPYVLMFLTSLWRSLFGNVPSPAKKNVIIVLIFEGLHSVGLSLLTFRVLPEIDVVRGILLLSGTCIVPSILKPMCSSSKNPNIRYRSTAGKIGVFILDMLAALTQISAVPVVVLTEYYINNKHFDGNVVKMVEVVIALFLCSFSYWENFVDDRFCGAVNETNRLQILILGLKFDLQECRPILYAIAAPVKVLVTGLMAFYFEDQETHLNLKHLSRFLELLEKEPKLFVLIPFVLVLAMSAFVGHFVAYTTCKLQMQIVSYAVPLLLSTPIAVYILYADCQTHFLLEISHEDRTCDVDLLDTWWHLPVAAGWLISLYWIGRHIWFPCQPRLAKLGNLFINTSYCGILMEQDLIMNRRRHTRKIVKVSNRGRTCYRLMPGHVKDTKSEDGEMVGIIPPMVYACGTMWHETRQEMVQLLKSLFRMDKDQFLRKKAVNTFDVKPEEVNYYEFEPHIFFDDAFETNADKERVPNSFVTLFVELMEEAASSVHEKAMTINAPIKIPTPYGGQLVYLMPGENLLFVHLKDKSKIRNRKRWSQVMYMYYLLGYRILKECQEVVMSAMKDDAFNDLVSWRQFERQKTGKVEKSQIFNFLDDEVMYRAQNTFILALDGDVDFSSGAVHLLIDKMKKNEQVGAVCGRIHPIGQGPVVWFQKFEYAVGHWLQKATEHVLGCVLCSTGCFSMFRGSSLMDDNVMRKFTILPTEASHYLMYDQGEDRWLCTLLLQQGYRVDYTAASDAFTHAPEQFDEFFNQRRRWMPSTIVNILELLQDGRNTVAINKNISWLYIFYQYYLMVSTVIGPGLVVMMIAGALGSVFQAELITSYLIAIIPAVVYSVLCFYVKQRYQILAAQILGAWYIFVMAVVFIGCIIIAVQENALHPSVILIESLVVMFIFAACIHPHEFSCVFHGAMYYLCIPIGFLLLVIYSLCNMHILSWGTREAAKKKTIQEIAEEERLQKEKKKQGFLARFMPSLHFQDIANVINGMRLRNKRKEKNIEMLRVMNKNFEALLKLKQHKGNSNDTNVQDTEGIPELVVQHDTPRPTIQKTVKDIEASHVVDVEDMVEDAVTPTKKEVDDMVSPHWAEHPKLGNGPILKMNSAESEFWNGLIHRYLYPLVVTAASQERIKERLLELRNSVFAGMAILNIAWIAINFMFQLRKPATIYFSVPSDVDEADVNTENFQVDVLGMLFVIFFGLMALIQFIGMLVHRWGTFLHLVAVTDIPNPFKRNVSETDIDNGNSKYVAEKVLEFCERLDSEPIPDYPMDSDDEEDEKAHVIRAMAEVINNIQVMGTKNIPGSTNPLGKSIRQTGFGTSSKRGSTPGRRGTSGANAMITTVLRRTAQPDNHLFDIGEKREKNKEIGTNKFNGKERSTPKLRFGAGGPLQKHFMSEVRNRKLPKTPEDFLKKERLSQTLTRGGYEPDAVIDTDTDNIYDTIPAMGTMDKAFSKKFKKFRVQ